MSANVRFYQHSVYLPDASAAQGRKVFKDAVYIEIRTSKNSSFSRPMTEKDKYSHPEAWGRYCLENAQETTGTPLKFLPATTSSLILQLDEFGVRSVEDLAAAGPEIDVIEGAAKLKKQAVRYLAAALDDDEEAPAPKRTRKPKEPTETVEAA